MYASVVSFTFGVSTVNSKLDADAPSATSALILRFNFSCARLTFFQTASCELFRFAASFSSFVATEFSELLKVADSSLPRLLQRPDSTQNAAIGMRPDFGGTIKSTEIMRS